MGLFRRQFWFATASGVILVFALVSLTAHRGPGLTAFADFIGLLIMLLAAGVTLINALVRPTIERSFWGLITLGFSLWAFNQGAWAYSENILHRDIPDPYFADIILFFHIVPMIAATAWRPDLLKRQSRVQLSTLHFLMLLSWWIFLYAFIVLPYQYIVLNVPAYDRYYNLLYQVENLLLLSLLGFAALTSTGAWKRLYLHFFAASAVYTVGARLLNEAVVRGTYYSGSWYDIPLIASVVWMAAAALSAGSWELVPGSILKSRRWQLIVPQLAMLSILSLPLLGLWTFLFDPSPPASHLFRLFTVLAAMLVLGIFVFLRQYIQDQTLIRLLEESRSSFQNQQRLQNHLVQKEKLASLGQLVAGAANEIDQPLNAIMSYSEKLWSGHRLTDDQSHMVRKIVNQARRTRDLISNLLSFAQQTPGEKMLVELGMLLQRSSQMLESRHTSGRIRVEISVPAELPRIRGNANQLFQAFVEIIENATDALEESGGGVLQINALRQGTEVVLQFSDNGPGLREPERVFDPFYTTKPIGKGTGLGLSVVYGVVQDHGGQITCQNQPAGGALFVVRFPIAAESFVPIAEAAKA